MEKKCLSGRQMIMSGLRIEQITFGYILPIFIAFGIVGNIINLTVLLTPSMRSRSFMLWFLALCDIVFLFFITPHSLAQYNVFALNNTFRWFYLNCKIHLITFTNWASAAAIWTILFICFERLLAIRYPLKVHRYTINRNLWRRTLIFLITVMTGFLTSYFHFSYTKIAKTFCNGTQFHAYHVAINSEKWPGNRTNPNPKWLQNYVYWSAKIHELFVIFMPTIIIIFANGLLILTLRSRTAAFAGIKPPGSITKAEQNVTYTVCAIVTAFTITQAPSGFVSLVITNAMVIVGKSLNFVLFCLSSATFRQRLVAIVKIKPNKRQQWKSSTTYTTTPPKQIKTYREESNTEVERPLTGNGFAARNSERTAENGELSLAIQ
uniref:G_PROTEIN_RECEP_F1_2 domain-containing protein n=1 Tax=Syphacia muris TaxID=451379 RepID=A0A0N5A877_9BILA